MSYVTGLIDKAKEAFSSDELFHETEIKANKLGESILIVTSVLLLIVFILTWLGLFLLSIESVFAPCVNGMIATLIIVIICRVVKYDVWWLKYVLLTGITLIYAGLDTMLTHKTAILMVIPVIFASRYFSRSLTAYTAVLSVISFAVSAYLGATRGLIDLNIVTMEAGTQMTATGGFLGDAIINAGVSDAMLQRNTLLFNFIPKWMMFTIAALISINITKTGRQMVIEQHDKDMKAERINTELALATKIQADALPNTFPAFPNKMEIDLYASMEPAKEVGGDFYDFYMIDEDHIALAIADVSGKGIPAALFMMVSKIMMENINKNTSNPALVLEQLNNELCNANYEEMFVTVWLAILEVSSGKLIAANAGHEYPIIKNGEGKYELYKDKHGFVIGGMEGMKYTNYEIQLKKDSKIFIYTDGLPEATNSNEELLGTDKIVETLNNNIEATPEETLMKMHETVDQFVQDAPQFDDLTMLCLHYKGKKTS